MNKTDINTVANMSEIRCAKGDCLLCRLIVSSGIPVDLVDDIGSYHETAAIYCEDHVNGTLKTVPEAVATVFMWNEATSIVLEDMLEPRHRVNVTPRQFQRFGNMPNVECGINIVSDDSDLVLPDIVCAFELQVRSMWGCNFLVGKYVHFGLPNAEQVVSLADSFGGGLIMADAADVMPVVPGCMIVPLRQIKSAFFIYYVVREHDCASFHTSAKNALFGEQMEFRFVMEDLYYRKLSGVLDVVDNVSDAVADGPALSAPVAEEKFEIGDTSPVQVSDAIKSGVVPSPAAHIDRDMDRTMAVIVSMSEPTPELNSVMVMFKLLPLFYGYEGYGRVFDDVSLAAFARVKNFVANVGRVRDITPMELHVISQSAAEFLNRAIANVDLLSGATEAEKFCKGLLSKARAVNGTYSAMFVDLMHRVYSVAGSKPSLVGFVKWASVTTVYDTPRLMLGMLYSIAKLVFGSVPAAVRYIGRRYGYVARPWSLDNAAASSYAEVARNVIGSGQYLIRLQRGAFVSRVPLVAKL